MARAARRRGRVQHGIAVGTTALVRWIAPGPTSIPLSVWERRRRYDGFVLLLGHPKLTQSARELVNFYRIKDTVEKDFQTIKSLVKLRPIYSYTDPKVQAHVTLCMLSLLVQRTLEHNLQTSGVVMTAPACIDVLETCHLNERRSNSEPVYDITLLNSAQQKILSALGLEHLADDDHLRGLITPRTQASQATSASGQPRRSKGRSK